MEREQAARAAQVGLTSPEEYGITPDGRLLPPPRTVASEILRLYSAHGSRSGIDPIKAASAAAAASPVQLTQTSRYRYRDEDQGYEDTLSLSATHDSGGSTQTAEDKDSGPDPERQIHRVFRWPGWLAPVSAQDRMHEEISLAPTVPPSRTSAAGTTWRHPMRSSSVPGATGPPPRCSA